MTELGAIFVELGISQYLKDFIDQGFDTWETILDIKESDFDALNVKLGHRRKLQRKIANFRGISTDRALESPNNSGNDGLEEAKVVSSTSEGKEPVAQNVIQGAKRKYRRHPKNDENAPERPPSAYVIFSNKMREDLKGRNLSFTEIAKLVGEHWQNLTPPDKEPYETHASVAKEKYLAELAEYKKTDQYKEYTLYLAEFKARQQNQQTDASKRPKLETQQPSTASTGTASSGASHYGNETPTVTQGAPVAPPHWSGKDFNPSPTIPLLNREKLSLKSSDPSAVQNTAVLPGYRESIYGGTTTSIPWRDQPRDDGANTLHQLSQMGNLDHRRSDPVGGPNREPRTTIGNLPSHPSSQSSNPPPLLKSESTNSTVSSSVYFTPRTPTEHPSERTTLPPIYAHKLPGPFENQLPPLRPPSLSPRTSVSGSLQSPTGALPPPDYPSLRGYGRASFLPQPGDPRQHGYMSSNTSEETLDPVSALLRAGEIVNRNSRNIP